MEQSPTPQRPSWDDEYLEAVAGRLAFNYDLERDYRVDGETFDLYAAMRIENERHFLHPAITFARHYVREHLFARRIDHVTVDAFTPLVELGERLAGEWIEPSERHYSTDFTFVLVGDLADPVEEFVAGYRNRTLLKLGYHGHYEINLIAVDPDTSRLAASEEADVCAAFQTWDPIDRGSPSRLDRFLEWITR